MTGHDPDDLTLIIELRDEVARLVADALKTEGNIFREVERANSANVVETAQVHGSYEGEMRVMHDALDAHDDRIAEALAAREAIGQAVGILVATMLRTPDEAFALLVAQSQHENRKLLVVAAEIVKNAASRARPR